MVTGDPKLHLEHSSGGARAARLLRENALSLVLLGIFAVSMVGQVVFGRLAYNSEREQWGEPAVTLAAYLTSGHFAEALFENWESEFLQMGVFVWLSARLVQKGSAESRSIDEENESDEDPRQRRHAPEVPWPVRRGGWMLWFYERSLGITFAVCFLLSFLLHARGGQLLENEELLRHGQPPQSYLEFVGSSQFWFESFQNWQSEFLAILSIVVLTIFLRQRGSPQSKPVAARHSETGV
jgi:hypothetical protein